MGIGRAAEEFSIFDIFAPTRESEDEDELEYEYDWGTSERLRGRRNERSSTSFPRNLFLVPRFRSSIVIVLELVLVLCCCRWSGLDLADRC